MNEPALTTSQHAREQSRCETRRASMHLAAACAALIALGAASCGGGGAGNPFSNPADVANASSAGGQKLSYAYFQRCINPIFLAQLQTSLNGVVATNTCAGAGCHANATGTGGSLRIVPTALPLDLTNLANTPDLVRASDMYKNFYSAQAATVPGDVSQSRLLNKPLLLNVLHGGGLIFTSAGDPNAKLIAYWISHPTPQGQDEFSTANYSMFTPADPQSGTCNTQ